MHDTPNLLACERVHRNGRVVSRGVNDTIFDDGERLSPTRVVERVRPNGNELFDVAFVDLFQWAKALALVAHAVDQNILSGFGIVEQILIGLSRGAPTHQCCQQSSDNFKRMRFFQFLSPLGLAQKL